MVVWHKVVDIVLISMHTNGSSQAGLIRDTSEAATIQFPIVLLWAAVAFVKVESPLCLIVVR